MQRNNGVSKNLHDVKDTSTVNEQYNAKNWRLEKIMNSCQNEV